MQLHSVTQRRSKKQLKQQQKQQEQEKVKGLLIPVCPLNILSLNKMLSLSVNIKRKRNKCLNLKNAEFLKNFKKISNSNDNEILTENYNHNNLYESCLTTTNNINNKKLNEKKNIYANEIKKKPVPKQNLCDENDTNAHILIATTTTTTMNSQSQPYTCGYLRTTTTINDKTKLLSSNKNNNNNNNNNMKYINYGQDKLVYASSSINNNNNNNNYKNNCKKTTQPAVKIATKTESLIKRRSRRRRRRLVLINMRERRSLATRINCCNSSKKSLLYIIMLFLILIPMVKSEIKLVNPFNNRHMTELINVRNSRDISNNYNDEIAKTPTAIREQQQQQQQQQQTAHDLLLNNIGVQNDFIENVQVIDEGANENIDGISKSKNSKNILPFDHNKQWRTLFGQLNTLETLSYDNEVTQIKGESLTDTLPYHEDYNSDDDNNLDNDIDESDAVAPHMKTVISAADNQKLLKLVIDGLQLQKLPDMSKANISQEEYSSKYREYLQRLHERQRRELFETRASLRSPIADPLFDAPLQFLTIAHNASLAEELHSRRKRDIALAGNYADYSPHAKSTRSTANEKNSVLLHFPLNIDVTQLQPDDIEEANVRLMLIHSAALAHKTHANKRPCHGKGGKAVAKQKHVINLKVYQLVSREKRIWLDGRKIEIEIDRSKSDQTFSQWLQFDVTQAVSKWLASPQENLGLEIQCSNCHRLGARILNDVSASATNTQSSEDQDSVDFQLMPVLNIIGRPNGKRHLMHPHKVESRSSSPDKHHHHTNAQTETGGRTDCHKENQRCCRHSMEVVFKEIKGYEFIIHPKVFDAGYCRGRCPVHYHTANNHAVLQSLVWQQNPSKAPRPCCAPSKLVELEILHVDENDAQKLKISNWEDMRVVECACT